MSEKPRRKTAASACGYNPTHDLAVLLLLGNRNWARQKTYATMAGSRPPLPARWQAMPKFALLALVFFVGSGSFTLAATIQIGEFIDVTDLGTDFVPLAGNNQNEYVGYRKSTNQAAVRRANGTVEDIGTLGGTPLALHTLVQMETKFMVGAQTLGELNVLFFLKTELPLLCLISLM